MPKGYVIGVSSGIFGAAQQEEKVQYISLSQKAFYGMFKGVRFTQIDLETVAEFKYPELKAEIERIKRLGIEFGIHGESGAFGGRENPIELDSAIGIEYRRAHERLIESIKGAGMLGARYFLIHASESEPFIRLFMAFQPMEIVDIWGNPFPAFLKKFPYLTEWAFEQEFLKEITRIRMKSKKELEEDNYQRGIKNYIDNVLVEKGIEIKEKDIPKHIRESIKRLAKKKAEEDYKELKDFWEKSLVSNDVTYGSERIAYYIIAKWMQDNKDPIWIGITRQNVKEYLEEMEKKNGKKPKLEIDIENQEFRENYFLWVPAVAAKYIWGHFHPEENPVKPSEGGVRFPDPKPLLEKFDMYFVLEQQMAPKGYEKYIRLARPSHLYYLCKYSKTNRIVIAIDFEHLLTANIDIDKELDTLPSDGGKYIKVLHVGWPTPLAPAHIPIAAGSDQQYILYKWLWKLRQKGFKDGWIIFERGGGKDPIQKTIQVLRVIVNYLEKDVPPEKLPAEFFILPTSKGYARQKVIIFEHALDPLKGVITLPEETYTKLGKAALEKGKKPEEWKKEELW
ncbi:MAG: hypothetical protein J7K98_01825 [Candidatus Aenigmarchaeota archaeon]|nr:hypothetical protein [Candidatus Aenigmarchaeota archaeon]